MQHDTFEAIRPKTRLFSSLDEAQEAVQVIQDEYKAKIGECV